MYVYKCNAWVRLLNPTAFLAVSMVMAGVFSDSLVMLLADRQCPFQPSRLKTWPASDPAQLRTAKLWPALALGKVNKLEKSMRIVHPGHHHSRCMPSTTCTATTSDVLKHSCLVPFSVASWTMWLCPSDAHAQLMQLLHTMPAPDAVGGLCLQHFVQEQTRTMSEVTPSAIVSSKCPGAGSRLPYKISRGSSSCRT